MAERTLFETIAAAEGWHERTQIDVLLQYVENQDSVAVFADFLMQMRADALEHDDPDFGQEA